MTASRNFVVLAALTLAAAGPLVGAPSGELPDAWKENTSRKTVPSPDLPKSPPALPTPIPSGDPVTDEMARLGDDNFRVREEATKKLWGMGAGIVPRLQQALKSPDPEIVKRANFLLRRIDFDITPDTPSEITDLVDRYSRAPQDQRMRLIYDLRQRRAWLQILKLYARETDPAVRLQIRPAVEGAAVFAAREAIVAGKMARARSLLELNPGDSQGLLALADFHRVEGTLKAELAKGQPPAGVGRTLWELALYRVSGDMPMARAAANAAKEENIVASCAVLEGDPLPWLEASEGAEGPAALRDIYRNLAEKRWRGNILTSQDMEVFEPYERGGDDGSRWMAANCLFLLGQPQAAETILSKVSPITAFRYYDSMERLPDAFRVLGLDPKRPDFASWIARNFASLGEDADQPEDKQAELIAVASFLERRGMKKELAVYDPLLVKLADNDPDTFLRFLGQLVVPLNRADDGKATTLAKRAAIAFAKDDAGRWNDVITHLFSETTSVDEWWEWLGKLDPKAPPAARLDGLFALFRIESDSGHQRDRWLKLAWADIASQPKEPTDESKEASQQKIRLMTGLSTDANDLQTGLRAWEMVSNVEEDPDETNMGYLWFLSAAGRWDKCADLWLKIANQQPGRADFHAYTAAAMRRAGRNSEATAQDAWVEKLVLADPATCVLVGQGYAYGGDFNRANQWWERAYMVALPGSDVWKLALQLNATIALERGDWSRAAAFYEIIALYENGYESLQNVAPGVKLRIRMTADYCRAFNRLKTDRQSAIALLQQCHRTLGPDGALADYFFPGLRKEGLIEQHDAWFEESWQALTGIIKAYPDCENTRNTAAWLAARAVRRLDEAAAIEDAALASSPDQAAYLDTRAEIQFARKDRKGAMEWSAKALSVSPLLGVGNPLNLDLRRQTERFRNAPFPVP
ncbi:hypothetical protein KBB96_10430 [Luteolibacter ambystomatis]|uniref:Tetratricopeptide repeat protein n=1 Tax=Luteolibacter ambystomatis TaxID=2824561 RepID=A0A975IXX5_9BACT|nr:hypothetical protein [Luteolibacter ambystomatis]QUE49288.1 hypothetical protein KBB96_10430 [Luteolibacter ambystomatis]